MVPATVCTQEPMRSASEVVDSLFCAGAGPAYEVLVACAAAARDCAGAVHPQSPGTEQLALATDPYLLRSRTLHDVACRKDQVARDIRCYRESLNSILHENEKRALHIELQQEQSDTASDRNKVDLADCYQQQTHCLNLIKLAESYDQTIVRLFGLVSNAQNKYEDDRRRQDLERQMHSSRNVLSQLSPLSGQAWELLSTLREIERKIENTLREMEYDGQGGMPPRIRPRPSWSDVAFMIVHLELIPCRPPGDQKQTWDQLADRPSR